MSASSIRTMNRTLLLAAAPFIGLLTWMLVANVELTLSGSAYPAHEMQPIDLNVGSKSVRGGLSAAESLAQGTGHSIKKQISLYNKTNDDMNQIAAIASKQAARPHQIYDKRITSKLGKPSNTMNSDKLTAQLFDLKADNFRGYALKIKLKKGDAMKLVLGKDENGGAETTLEAVKRYKAAIGINGGGFADGGGKRYPLSTTIVDGEYVSGFQPTFKDLFFVGMSESNKLIGGKFTSKSQLDSANPKFGASFVPILLQNGRMTEIPLKWQTSPKRAPRTVIANYKDDQLLFLVVDGYNEKGSSGATLMEMQILLKRYGAINGYNLDGGGSTSLVWNGRVVNNPSDGQLRKLPTNFLFFS
ncbi:phosphodiester glycosidase family protein [Cohnella sp. LGH]|uniref:phosphodiester glycosidase family protein n=1 Tax=Cohnella sp. LGH TaxID=1619153 RepID=UPI001ADA7A67|nr:phosphodiester glycosidase family protein [Cohnella sp. LGH]QTH40393.1 phosphodiester glycosidase family protein [Cohnella sp. LGH]